jgi:hypothetical protein
MRRRELPISSSTCFSSSRIARCAATVSARRLASSIPARVVSNSGGILRFSLTYCSNSETSERIVTSSSFSLAPSSTVISSHSASKNPLSWTYLLMRTRSPPSTSTLVVPSGNFSNCSTVARVPTLNRSTSAGSSISALR